MRTRTRPLVLVALLCALALPLAGDAGIPVPPASKTPCCTVADAPPPPPSKGDEEFFSIPAGVPNVMLVVDNSGSMLGLPREMSYPTSWPATNGTCSGHWLNGFSARKSATPYDNGYSTALVADDPAWGLARCQLRQAEPTGNDVRDYCLFRPTSYYKGAGDLGTGGFWDDTTAWVYNQNPCASVDSGGNVIMNYATGSPVLLQAQDVNECLTCLQTAGFYVMRGRPYRTSGGSNRTSPDQVVFKGDFLNGYPPKHVIARKVVKDIVKLDPANPRNTDDIRFGLTVFTNSSQTGGFSTSLRAGDGGRLIVPVGPSCGSSFPVNRSAFATARQAIVDSVNALDATGLTPPYVPFGGATPLAETLFTAGQYFTNTGASALYSSLFGSAWVRASFNENAAGAVNASWASGGTNHSFCWPCQQSSIIVVTDGAPNGDSNLPRGNTTTAHANFGPTNDFRYWANPAIDCPLCKCDLSSGGSACSLGSPVVPASGRIPNLMHKVAYFLAQTDLRPDLANGSRPQSVSTYTISFGLDPTGITDASAKADAEAALALLRKTAELGEGLFANTSSGDELAAALDTAVTDVVQRTTSFASANASTFQISKTNNADAYLGRFRPTSATFWEGHLFAAMIFDEFGQGCSRAFPTSGQKTFACGRYPNQNPNIDGDETAAGKAICESAYLVDAECDPIIEDDAGTFKKGHFDADGNLQSDPDDATLYWDAGRALSDPTYAPPPDLRAGVTYAPGAAYRSAEWDASVANRRRIYTVIDVDGDGRLTAADGKVEFTPDNAEALAPFLSLDQTWCRSLLERIGVCGAPPLTACSATWTSGDKAACAAQIIHFFRGWDVLDADNDHCGGPGNWYNTNPWGSCTASSQCGAGATCSVGKCINIACPSNGEQRDRPNDSRPPSGQEFWKLGDIFHSSPVLVKSPVDKFTCRLAIENQCLATIYSLTSSSPSFRATPLERSGVLDAYDLWRRAEIDRQQFVVVGANDGMLHAFDAGTPDTSKPANLEGRHPFTNGTGAELWAFIPPDLLPRLKYSFDNHQYLVDGSTMVRDVWVDANLDGVKQRTEFHTVAVITERSGGTRYTALDVTAPTNPRFLWTFPEGCTEDSRLVAQTWSDFLPRPPPIGAVRLAIRGGSPADPEGRGFEERWVVMLNGGYDPALVRGRAVWMLDVWTGRKLWQFTDADLKALVSDPGVGMGPVPAAVAMVDIGEAKEAVGDFKNDTYFDTATWGDMHGNVFVARFDEPGRIDPSTGMVENWFAARTFEQNRQTDDRVTARNRAPFFFMTANFIDAPSRLYTVLGTGNYARLMQQTPRCGPDSLTACCQNGCSVVSATGAASYGAGSCSTGGTFSCSGGTLTYTPAATTGCDGAFTCGGTTQTVTLDFACGAAGDPAPITATLTCDAAGTCSVDNGFSSSDEFSLSAIAPACGNATFRDGQYGIWSYGIAPEKRFTDAAGAEAFDDNRFTDVPFAGCGGTCSLVEVSAVDATNVGFGCRDGSSCRRAEVGDPGWMLRYGRFCQTEGCSGSWCDERTATQTSGDMSCAYWSSFRPTGAASSGNPCESQAGTPTSFGYIVDFRYGVATAKCRGFDEEQSSGAILYGRATTRSTTAPPQAGTRRLSVNDKNEVQTTLFKQQPGGGTEKTELGTRTTISDPLYWLEVPRAAHVCRHDPAGATTTALSKCE
jgi:type IV pilus assembly protein PilY1